MMDKQPLYWAEYEGGQFHKWEKGNKPNGVHALIFADGSVFDTYNGWRSFDPSTLEHARNHWVPYNDESVIEGNLSDYVVGIIPITTPFLDMVRKR